ncbi:uncharacterized protein LOC144744663 [Ciona intestinalis]
MSDAKIETATVTEQAKEIKTSAVENEVKTAVLEEEKKTETESSAEKVEEKTAAPEVEDQEESDEDEEEEIVLDEASDTENYELSDTELEADHDDDVSSGEEEGGIRVEESVSYNVKFYKLRFKDVEDKQREHLKSLQNEEDSQESANSDTEADNKENVEQKEDTDEVQAPKFSDYRAVFDQDMDDYKSEEDDDFNPIYCGETLSDVEYKTEDERDTESEPEVEEMDAVHRKTGEALRCLRIVEKLEVPPDCGMEAGAVSSPVDIADSPMECA